ncbi:uncharacterized protein PODANS_7_3555 [Podospora anserina S mat+]|uniref:Podospora anserina S mat+ genomic DNA chromosome 7, supercontig 1 n=1 Tax=Podospora anserina (strain S / ATCC MYA-4624 / DSM 980 / FGSC 10383) TaxID=515849 RepID=B2AVA9_PODAN|nr:uncharacterized protein PODANS_7_3555 [Podospora anserina S mat+]CAP68332.1 unnamed protein product [Podospora anserina S mat+]CDP31803.1 Putative protein of unknown function [Podospora anserina S mat+]
MNASSKSSKGGRATKKASVRVTYHQARMSEKLSYSTVYTFQLHTRRAEADQGIQNRGGRKATDPNDLIKAALQDGLTEEKSEIDDKPVRRKLSDTTEPRPVRHENSEAFHRDRLTVNQVAVR